MEPIDDLIKIAFCAGVLEGEACFDIRKSNAIKRDPNNKAIRIIVEMKDVDVLYKLQECFGGTVTIVKCQSKVRPSWSTYYKWLLSNREGIYYCLRSIRPYMSERRSERISEMLEFIERKFNEDCPNQC